MGDAARNLPDELELEVDAAIALCDGDVRAALRATLVYKQFLELKLEHFRGMISSGYTRRKVSSARKASKKVDEWRELAERNTGLSGDDG